MCVDRGKRTNNISKVGLKKAPFPGAFFNTLTGTLSRLLDRLGHRSSSQDNRGVGGEVELADHAIFNAIRSIAELIL